MILDKQQKVVTYISGMGIRAYEIQQYNKELKHWYVVGDCSISKALIKTQVQLHNIKLSGQPVEVK